MPDHRRGGGSAARYAWLVVAGALLPAAAAGQSAQDQLAATIEQSLTTIEFRADIRPEQAARDLAEQRRKVDLLAQEAPDHPALPGLREHLAELEAVIASSGGDEPEAAGGGVGEIPTAPDAFDAGMREVDTLLKQAEAEFMRGRTEEAAGFLAQAEAQMDDLERRYEDDIPAGHVGLIVAKERQATLKDHLEDAGTAPDDPQ